MDDETLETYIQDNVIEGQNTLKSSSRGRAVNLLTMLGLAYFERVVELQKKYQPEGVLDFKRPTN